MWNVRDAAGLPAVLLAGALLLAAGCDAGGSGDPSDRSSAAPSARALGDLDLAEAKLTVGSKEFTEQLVLGHVARRALEEAGADVDEEIGSTGTAGARAALLAGEIDLYWEYTGTAWIEFLEEDEPISDAGRQYRAVAERDLERNDVAWLTPAPFNNTYALATREDTADELVVDAISDLGRLLEERPQEVTICVASEFASRRDGLPGVERHYGFDVPERNISIMDTGVVYTAVDRGDPCNFGEVFRTDPRISSLGLRLLADDKHFFPVYNPAVTIRRELLERHPAIADVFERVAPELDEETMTELNRQVDVEGELPARVAERWLRGRGLID